MTLDPTLLLVCGFGFAGLAFTGLGVSGLRRRRAGLGIVGLLLALLSFSLGALAASLAVGLQGYRALTREDVAAVVETRPTGSQRFEARFVFPDGVERSYDLAGDQLAVEARILKWHPWANFLGLHTAYELDRVTGRYARLSHERSAPRTVYALGRERPIDLFAWRRRLAWLAPAFDAEYGSASFTRADRPARYEVRVSTTGLLVREVSFP